MDLNCINNQDLNSDINKKETKIKKSEYLF